MGEREIMPKRTAKSKKNGHKYSFFDILIFLFACSISIGAIYYFFIIDKYQEPGLEPTKHTKSKLELKSNSSKIDSANKDKDVNPKSSNGTKILNPKKDNDTKVSNSNNGNDTKVSNPKKDNDKKELNPKNPSTQTKIDPNGKDGPKDNVKDDSSKDYNKPKAQKASVQSKNSEESKKANQSSNTEDPKNDTEYINPGPSFLGEYGIPSNDVSNGSNESEKEHKFEKNVQIPVTENVQPKTNVNSNKKEEKSTSNVIDVKVNKSNESDQNKAPPNYKDSDDFFEYGTVPPFFKEIKSSNIQVISTMIELNAPDLKEKSNGGFNAFQYAASLMKVDIMKLFLERGLFDVNGTIESGGNFGGNTALHLVCLASKWYPERAVEAVELLIDNNANIGVGDLNGFSPIFGAVYGNSIDLVKLLLSKGELISSTASDIQLSLLHYSMEICHRPMIKLLIDSGANINSVSKINRQPIHEAAAVGCVDGLKELILTRRVNKQTKSPSREENLCDKKYKDICLFGASPLHFAAKFEQLDTIEFLFLVQSEFNAIDEVGSISQNYAETSKILEIRNYFRDRKEWESRNPGNNRTNVVAGLRRLDGFTDPDTNELYETYLRHHLHKRRN
jgi:ankyrin repeat protein